MIGTFVRITQSCSQNGTTLLEAVWQFVMHLSYAPKCHCLFTQEKVKTCPEKDFSMNVHNISHDSQNLEATQMSINRRLDEQIAVKSRN